MCTTISNGATINADTSVCSGTYSGVTVNAKLTVDPGQTVILNSPTINSGASFYVRGSLKLVGTVTISGDITITDSGYFEVTGNLTIHSGSNTLNIDNVGQIKVGGEFECNVYFTAGYNPVMNFIGTATFNADVQINSGTLNAAHLVLNAYSGLAGKIVVTGYTILGASSQTTIDCCMLKTQNFLNSAAANMTIGTSYLEINGSAFGANALTAASTIEVYKHGGGGNMGSATIVAKKNPSPC